MPAIRATLPFLATILSLMACGGDPIVNPPSELGQIRVFHGAPGIGAVSVTAGGQAVITGVDYGSLSKPAEVPAGNLAVEAMASGSPVAGRSITIAEGQRVTLVLSRQSGAAASLAVVSDTGEARSNRANLRINSAPEVPRAIGDSSGPSTLLDVYVTATGVDLNAATARMSLESSYPSYSTFLYYEPGQLLVRFTRAGTKTVVAQAGPIAFAAGEAKAVVIRRSVDGSYSTRIETVSERP